MQSSSLKTSVKLQDLALMPNAHLASQSKSWIGAEALMSPQTLFDGAGIEISFKFKHTCITRKFPLSLSTATLHHVAFRAIKGEENLFELCSEGQSLPRSKDLSVQAQGLSKNTTVTIVPFNGPQTVLPSGEHDAMQFGKRADSCLLRVHSKICTGFNFSYWVPITTDAKLTSVIFRGWRFAQEKKIFAWPHDVLIRTGMKNDGDGFQTSKSHVPWASLSTCISAAKKQFETSTLQSKWDNAEDKEHMVFDIWMLADQSTEKGKVKLWTGDRVLPRVGTPNQLKPRALTHVDGLA